MAAHAILLEAGVERIARDAQPGRRVRDVPLAFLQSSHEMLAHRLLRRDGAGGRCRGGGRRGWGLHLQRVQHRAGDHGRLGEQRRSFDHVGELTNIPGPGIGAQARLRLRVQALRRQAIVGAGTCEEALGEEEHIAVPISQWGQGERDHRQPVVEIFPEAPLPESRLEVDVRGADEADVNRLGPSTAEAPHNPLLYGGEELGLDGLGQQPDLVQEERAPVCGLKEARLGPVGAREGAPLEAE